MTVRNVKKNLAAQQDLLPGVGPYQQVRRGVMVPVDGPAKSYIELWKEYCGEAYVGTFEDGFVTKPDCIAVSLAMGKAYRYTATAVVVMPANSPIDANWVELSSSAARDWVITPITWPGFAGGAKGDSASNTTAISAANASGETYSVPDGYWPNTVDATFNIYPNFRNYSGGLKLKRGLPGTGAQNPYPLIWAEKTSNMQRVDGGTKWFDVAMQGALTLEPTATAFGVGVSGYIRSAAGDVLTAGKSVDAIGVHGSGKAIGQNGRVWGLWGQAGNGDDGSGVRSSQLVACELNLVNLFASQPHPENLPTGEGPYRGLIVTTADGGRGCGIAIDVGDGSGRAAGESGWWTGLRLRRGGILPSGDWKNNYLEDSQQLKIEGSLSNTHRYGGIRVGPRADGTGVNLTYGLNTIGTVFQDFNAINLDSDHRIYWGPISGATKWIGYEPATTFFNFRNMALSINSVKVLGPRVTGINALTGTADGATKDTGTVTLVELARYVKKVTDALIAHGMISPT